MSSGASATLYYDPDGFDTSQPKLMGRQAAGEGFLRGLARHAEPGPLTAWTQHDTHYRHFEAQVAAATGGARETCRLRPSEPDALARAGCLFFPAPIDPRWAWIRRRGDQRAASLCGLTHTTASERMMHQLGALLTAPVQPWDALVCTSDAVRDMVVRVLESYADYLRERFSAQQIVLPQLPVIPLGVDCQALAPSDAARERGLALRARHGISKDALVVLFVGRLSYHGKAHPLPLFVALERAAKRCRQRVALVMAGWFANEPIEREFREAAAALCPSVDVCFADGRHPEVRAHVWHAADVFASPSDNIQETFGLTPVEAMAAGLPCVVSDWDGYRGAVRDGQDGFCVPTWLPPAGAGDELARRHHIGVDDYDHYIGRASQFAAVDTAAFADALTALLSDADRRRAMGERARARACSDYDWACVVKQYEALWAELAERRSHEAESAESLPGAPAAPMNDDPFRLFGGYASATLGGDTEVTLGDGASEQELERLVGFAMNRTLAEPLTLDRPTLVALLRLLADGGTRRVAELVDTLDTLEDADDPALLRSVVWLAKLGLVRLSA